MSTPLKVKTKRRKSYHAKLPEFVGHTPVECDDQASSNRHTQALEDPRVRTRERAQKGRRECARDEKSDAPTVPLGCGCRQSAVLGRKSEGLTRALAVEERQEMADLGDLDDVVIQEHDLDGSLHGEREECDLSCVGLSDEVGAVLQDVFGDDLVGEIIAALETLDQSVELALELFGAGDGSVGDVRHLCSEGRRS